MNYTTLTYNGITKICDKNIYLDPAKKVIPYQWFLPQLQEIAKSINISIQDEFTGLYYGKNTLTKKIKQIDPLGRLALVPQLEINVRNKKLGLIPATISQKKTTRLTYPDKELKLDSKKGIITNNWDLIEFIESDDVFLSEKFAKTKEKKPNENSSDLSFSYHTYDYESKKSGVTPPRPEEGRIDKVNYLVTKMTENEVTLPQFGRFIWDTNSCYADSALFALLNKLFKMGGDDGLYNHPIFISEVIDKTYIDVLQYPNLRSCKEDSETILDTLGKIENIHQEVLEIIDSLQSEEVSDKFITLNSLRDLMETCEKMCSQSYWTIKTQDSGEFLFDLLGILQVDIKSFSKISKVFTNNNSKIDKFKAGDEDYIPNDENENTMNKIVRRLINGGMLHNISDITNISRFIDYHDDKQEVNYLHISEGWKDEIQKGIKYIVNENDSSEMLTVDEAIERSIVKSYKYLYENTKITSAGLLIFQVDRGEDMRNILNETEIIPDKNITLEDGNILSLFSIVCYVGAHYICLFKFDEVWYTYDDLKWQIGHIKRIGSYDNMLHYNYEGHINKLASTRGTLYYYGQ